MAKRRRKPPRPTVADLVATAGKAAGVTPPKPSHPSGMEPGVRLEPGRGIGTAVAVVQPGQDPCWDELLGSMGFGGVLDVLEVIEVRAWGSADDMRHYVKARVRRRGGPGDADTRADVEALCVEIMSGPLPEPPAPARIVAGDRALVVALSDWQLGKPDGDGTAGTVARILRLIERVKSRAAELAAVGRPVSRLVVAGMGDLVEGCAGHYPAQTYGVELDRREQTTVVRRLLVRALREWAPLAPEVVVACVPGNHGENRGGGGKFYTTPGDNDDVAVFEQAAEILAAAGEPFAHVAFTIPRNELAVTLDVCGVPLAISHGHLARRGGGGGGPQRKLLGWWRDMAHQGSGVGSCRLLISAHYHHLQVVQTGGGKTWLQCPALDGGSDWWAATGGGTSPAGTLSLVVGSGCGPLGWSDMQVLS